MKLMKKCMALALVAAMVVTLAPANEADAAKKVSLSAKKKTIAVKKSFKLKVKNAKKSAKVTWKTSKKKVAKIKKATKRGNASATIVGVKKGSAVITAKVKTGKKTFSLKCKVTVGKVAPAPSTAPSVAPSTAPSVAPSTAPSVAPSTVPTATKQPTPRPTRTPKPSPTPSPTPMPDQEFQFEEVANGIPIDVSTYVSLGGNGGYNAEKGRVEINDQAASDVSQGSWPLPNTIPTIQLGDMVTFRVQGYNYGTSGFRFWIGNAHSGGCTPILLNNTIDETLAVGEYPCVVTDEEGNSLTKNQMKLVPDEETRAFDVTFTFKAGESQNDVDGVFTDFTLKYIMGGDTSGYIDGLCIKNIYYITDDASLLPTPTPDPDATATPAPDFTAVKVDAPMVVDGMAEEAWTDIEAIDFASKVGAESATTATAKLAWDAANLYGLVEVKDADINAESANDYERDGVEFFLDEDNDAVTTYAANTDAFQYRFTGLTKDAEGTKIDALTDAIVSSGNDAATLYAGIETEYTYTEEGYIVEFKIPFMAEKLAGARVGFDSVVQDCKTGGVRDGEIYLGQTDAGKSYYNLADTFKTLELIEIVKDPEGTVVVDLATADTVVVGPAEGTKATVEADGSISYADEAGFGGIMVKLPEELVLNNGESFDVTIEYESTGCNGRLYLVKDGVDSAASNIIAPVPATLTGTVTATADGTNYAFIKAQSWDAKFNSLKIKSIKAVKAAAVTE